MTNMLIETIIQLYKIFWALDARGGMDLRWLVTSSMMGTICWTAATKVAERAERETFKS